MMTLADLQFELDEWRKRNFPNEDAMEQFMGIVEEVGELSHSILKQKQKIRGTYVEHEEKIKDACGDIVIFLINFCSIRGYSLQNILESTWQEVKERDWIKNNKTGK